MIEFTTKGGNLIKYETPFVIDSKYLIKTRFGIGGKWEGPWAYLHPDDKEDYDADRSGKLILVVSANDLLAGVPNGAIYPATLRGIDRPECNMGKLIPDNASIMYCAELFEQTVRHIIDDKPAMTQECVDYYKTPLGDTHGLITKLQKMFDNGEFPTEEEVVVAITE